MQDLEKKKIGKCNTSHSSLSFPTRIHVQLAEPKWQDAISDVHAKLEDAKRSIVQI